MKMIVDKRMRLKQSIEKKQKEMLKYLKNVLLPKIKQRYTGKEDEEAKAAK